MMRNNKQLIELMERTLNLVNHHFSKEKLYEGLLLSITQLHTIEAIGNHPGINLITLANLKGVTKGAESQMIYKLKNKNLITKKTSEYSDKEIQLWLTELGTKVYEKHKEYHKNNQTKINYLLKGLSDNTYQELKTMLIKYNQMLNE